jgi:hypothetical protein
LIGAGPLSFASSFSESVTFSGAGGVLALAQSQGFAGKIGGFSKTGATSLDLEDIAFAEGTTTASYAGNTNSGVLTITDGTHTAHIHFFGDYTASTWTLSSDGHGGTTVVDPAKSSPSAHVFAAAAAGLGAGAAGATAIHPQVSLERPTALFAPHSHLA